MSHTRKARLGVLLSGRGSNFVAIADAIQTGKLTGCEIVAVLSNIADAPGVATARERGLHTEVHVSKDVPRPEHDQKMIDALHMADVDFVILAGYMRLLSPEFIRAFPERILNIHPSLLPAFPGLHAQKQALDYGTKVTGCTVHFVDEVMDHGVIILQHMVNVEDGDDESALSARILEQEHLAYPEAIARVLSGEYQIHERRYIRRTNKA